MHQHISTLQLLIYKHHGHTTYHACHNYNLQFHSSQVSSEVKGKRLAAHMNFEVSWLTVEVGKKADWYCVATKQKKMLVWMLVKELK